MSLVVYMTNQYEIESGLNKKTFSGEVFPYITATGDLSVIRETKGRNKTVACFAAGNWKEVEVV